MVCWADGWKGQALRQTGEKMARRTGEHTSERLDWGRAGEVTGLQGPLIIHSKHRYAKLLLDHLYSFIHLLSQTLKLWKFVHGLPWSDCKNDILFICFQYSSCHRKVITSLVCFYLNPLDARYFFAKLL